jgi:hypothetical protein
MTRLRDIVTINTTCRDAAIRLDDGLSARAEALVDQFTPTHSSIAILWHLQKAVLANAPQQSRAIIWHGVYGSGKSHLGVVAGQLLRNGTGSSAILGFLDRLRNQGEVRLCDAIKTTFHAVGDQDARPYFVVTLYGSPAPTLQNALLEGLYHALRDTKGLDPQEIIPKTEFAAALERLIIILGHHPEYRVKPLSDWQIRSAAFNLDELETQLIGFDPNALETFKAWHPKISAGATFDPQALGGKAVREAFLEAAAVLTRNHGYNGIAVIWDEFGYALEHLINQPHRNPVEEIFELQKFVETVCAPPKGHTLFVALTHRSLREYGASTQAGVDIKSRLETIEGRFSGFPVALKSSETEGYHLLSTLVAPTDQGLPLLEQARTRAEALAQVCTKMPLFLSLTSEVERIVTGCYPLHPVTAAGLFAIAAHGVYAQANRTVFTFFQNLEAATAGVALERAVDLNALYGAELIRLPELLTVYRKDVFEEYPGLADAYNHAVATMIQGFPEGQAIKRDILGVLLLARVLGEQFQPTEAFLAATLYDAETEPLALKQELEILHRSGLIWRRDMETPVWELEFESGTQIEPLIEQELKQMSWNSVIGYFNTYPDIRQDLLPQCGIHDFDPSPAGIVRSFEVRLIAELLDGPTIRPTDERLSALVLFLTLEDSRQVDLAIKRCEEMLAPKVLTYVWIPKRGLAELLEPLRRYIVIAGLLQQQATGESVARRLRNEWDKTRKLLRKEINERLGRVALERGDVLIKQLGDPDKQVSVTSWHGFSEYLAIQVQALYAKEIQVRVMNANRLYNPEERRFNRIDNLLHNILNFNGLTPKLRNDLLGEGEGSELAALIDGILGIYSNSLLIERADGWALKTPDEADGPVGEVLQLIRDTVTDKQYKVYAISKLRAKLIAPPYGLPPMVMSVLMAVAIRRDASRLKWVGETGAFESLLWEAFTANNSLKLRFDTFKPKHLQVLDALHQVLWLRPPASGDLEEQARETISGLRSFYSKLPDAVKDSGKLSEDVRTLFHALKKPGLDSQDVADCLLDITKGALNDDQIRANLQGLFDSIESIKDERVATVRQVITPVLRKLEQKQRITQTLSKQGHTELVKALEQIDQGDMKGLPQVVRIIAGKDLDQCSDIEIGRLSGDLERLLKDAGKPEPLSSQESQSVTQSEKCDIGITPIDHIAPLPGIREQSVEELFRQELAALIERYQAALDGERLAAILTNHAERLDNSTFVYAQGS